MCVCVSATSRGDQSQKCVGGAGLSMFACMHAAAATPFACPECLSLNDCRRFPDIVCAGRQCPSASATEEGGAVQRARVSSSRRRRNGVRAHSIVRVRGARPGSIAPLCLPLFGHFFQ